jgi:hypothetical protein
MTFVWKDKALRAAGRRGVAKARAYGLANNRRAPISLARVRFLERPVIPASEREKTGKPPAREVAPKMQSSVRSPRERRLTSSVPLSHHKAPQRNGRQNPNARRGVTWRGPYGRQRGARLDTRVEFFTCHRRSELICRLCCGARACAPGFKSRMSLGDWLSVIVICAAVTAIGIALARVVRRSETHHDQ